MLVALTILSGQVVPAAAEDLTAYVSPNVRYSSSPTLHNVVEYCLTKGPSRLAMLVEETHSLA